MNKHIMTDTGEVTLLRKGMELDVEWKMKFTSFSKQFDTVCFSPDFYFRGEFWFMAIFSNDSISTMSVENINLRLYKRLSCSLPINVDLSFSLKTVNGKKEFKRQITRVFEGFSCHGIDLFLSKSAFQKRQSEFIDSGFLTMVCNIKTLNSTGSASNIATGNCSYCKKTFDVQKLCSHEKKCRVKCPECSDVILLQNWDKHECQISRAEAATNTTEAFVVHHHNKILQDFKQVLEKQENCDAVLRVKGREFPAHKLVLAARSPVFASTFRNDMKEKQTGILDIEDCDPSVFPDFLCFLYSDDVDNFSEENVFSLFTAADKYDIPDLRGKCLEFMKENLSVETFCETLTLALQHSEAELVHLATNFFLKNAKKILVNVKWQSFAAENTTQSNELVIKYVESVEGPNS